MGVVRARVTYPHSPTCKNLTLSGRTAHHSVFFLEPLNFQPHKAAGATSDFRVAQDTAPGNVRSSSLQESL